MDVNKQQKCLHCNGNLSAQDSTKRKAYANWLRLHQCRAGINNFCSLQCYAAASIKRPHVGEIFFEKIVVWTYQNCPDSIHIHATLLQPPFPFAVKPPILQFNVPSGTGEQYVKDNFNIDPEVKNMDHK